MIRDRAELHVLIYLSNANIRCKIAPTSTSYVPADHSRRLSWPITEKHFFDPTSILITSRAIRGCFGTDGFDGDELENGQLQPIRQVNYSPEECGGKDIRTLIRDRIYFLNTR